MYIRLNLQVTVFKQIFHVRPSHRTGKAQLIWPIIKNKHVIKIQAAVISQDLDRPGPKPISIAQFQ